MNKKLKKELIAVLIKYSAAIKQVETYIKILEEDYTFKYDYNPIDHISSRLKTIDSILDKIKYNKVEEDIIQIQERILDIAGIRIVCQYEDDVYKMVELLKESHHFDIIKEKDYIKSPKKSGYRSYHLIINTHIHLISGTETVPVEIQIRTLAMDFWANLEHKMKYKAKEKVDKKTSKEWINYAKIINKLDNKIMLMNNL